MTRFSTVRRWVVGLAGLLFLSLSATGCASGSSAEKNAEPTASETDEWESESTETSSDQTSGDEQAPPAEEKSAQTADSAESGTTSETSAGEKTGADQTRTTQKTETSRETSSPSAGKSPNSQIESAVEAASSGNYERATRVLERLSDHPKKGHLASYNLGIVREMKGEDKAAVRAYQQALSTNPGFSPALLNLVRLHIRQGRIGPADAAADRYIGERPDNLGHRVAKLEVLLAQNQYETVVRKAKEILRQDEKNVDAMVAMARANFHLERYELAEAILGRAEELAADRAEIYFLYGLVAQAKGERDRAIQNLEKAVSMRARFPEARNALGLLYQEAGDYQAAAEQFEKALKTYPEFKEALLNLGIAYRGMGKFREAEASFKRVLELDSDYADAYFNLGVLYLDNKLSGIEKIPRLEKAIDFFRKYKRAARRIGSDDPVDDYMSAAREKIKAERQRQKMMRQMQKSGPSSGGGGSGASGSSNGSTSGGSSSNDGSSSSGDSSGSSGSSGPGGAADSSNPST
ncbi:MAG: tetratricopeptide repeat protein [Bradymonadaceae bacterium]